MRRLRGATSLLMGLVGLAGRLLAADQPGLTRDPLTAIAPLPSLMAFATARQIPVEGITVASDGAASRPGDQVVLLLTLETAGVSQQWLVRLETDALTAKERALKPLPTDVIHTSTGLELNYPNTRTALRVEFSGPFQAGAAGPAPSSRQARALVSQEYLDLGIARYCETALQIMPRALAAGLTTMPRYNGGSSRFSAEAVAEGKRAVAPLGLVPEEERLAFSVYFALRTFFSAAMEIPACQEVLEQVIQKPSVWSVLGRFGVSSNFEYGWHEVQIAPGVTVAGEQPVFLLPLRVALNATPAVKATLAVTAPRPPLQTAAGIIALCAEHPTAPDRRLFIRALSARRAASDGP